MHLCAHACKAQRYILKKTSLNQILSPTATKERMSDIYREPKGDFAMKALMHDGKYFRSLRTVNLTLQHHASTITSDDDRYFSL